MTALMAYGCVIALLLGLAAWVGEHWLNLRQWPRRWVWAAALSASLVLPASVVSVAVQSLAAPARTSGSLDRAISLEPRGERAVAVTGGMSGLSYPAAQSAWDWLPLRQLDAVLPWLWLIASVGLSGWLGTNYLKLRREIQQLPHEFIDGIEVRVAERLGPAVFGIVQPQIILPRWLIDAPQATRALVIAHERSHQRAGDPLLLMIALLFVVLIPWNVPLWWQLRRLRFAIEVDCDQRVLQGGSDVAAYGETLLAVAQSASRTPLGVMALTEPASQLERRIRIMTRRRPSAVGTLLFVWGLGSVSLVGAATLIEPPAELVAFTQAGTASTSEAEIAAGNRLIGPVTDSSDYSPTAPTRTPTSAQAGPPGQVQIDTWIVLGNADFKRRLESHTSSTVAPAILDFDLPSELLEAGRRQEITILSQPTLITIDQLEGSLAVAKEVPFAGLLTQAKVLEQPVNPTVSLVATPRITIGNAVDMDLSITIDMPDKLERTDNPERVAGTSISSTQLHTLIPDGQTLLLGSHRVQNRLESAPNAGNKEQLYFFVRPTILLRGGRFNR